MEDTKGNIVEDGKRIQVFSELVNRVLLASRLGMDSYNGNRDLYQALGYKKDLSFADFFDRYRRQDIAKAVVDRPVKSTWQGELALIESNEVKETEFEKSWRILNREFKLKSCFARLDKLTGLGRYGVLLLGLDDVVSKDAWRNPVKTGDRKLYYLKPLSEATAKIARFEERATNERYGLPLMYEIEVADANTKMTSAVLVHYSRIIHVTDNSLESDVYGTPKLEPIYNRLMDIEKLAGGDAEMFWRGARPGYHGKLDPDYQATQAFKDDLKAQIDEFEHNLRRILVNEGVDMKAMDQQIADPSSHLDTQLKLISAETGIPVRILTGSERGELASSEDRSEWLSFIQTRREEHAEPNILRPVVDKFIDYGILPKPSEEYYVEWSELFAQSEKMRVDIGKARANAIAEYTRNPLAMEVIPPSVFMEKCLGFSGDEIEWVYNTRDEEMEEEIEKLREMQEIIDPEPPAQTSDVKKSKERRGEPKQRRKTPDASV